jgi:hypothetical protein
VALASLAAPLKRPRFKQPLSRVDTGRKPKGSEMSENLFRSALLVLSSLSCTNLSLARDMDGQYAVFGVGGENCAAYLVARDRAGDIERWYHDWLAGYLSAVNNAGESTYNILGDKSLADILDWLEGYCAANPNSNFSNAVADLVGILYPDRHNIAPDKQGGWNKAVTPAENPPTP